jgi:hypothetical protein
MDYALVHQPGFHPGEGGTLPLSLWKTIKPFSTGLPPFSSSGGLGLIKKIIYKS